MTATVGAPTENKHVVVFPTFFWGHARPLCTLVARMVRLRPTAMRVTYVTFPKYHARVLAELVRDFPPGEEHLMNNINVVSIEESAAGSDPSGAPGAFKAAWTKLVGCQPLMCAKTGKQVEAVAVPPSAAVMGFFVVDAYEAAREISGKTIPLYVWYSASTNFVPFVFAEDPRPLVEAEVVHTGMSSEEAAFKMATTLTGRVVHSPYMPSMHDYELHPQEHPVEPKMVAALMKMPSMLRTSEGLVTFDAADYQPEATTVARQLLGQTSRKAFYTGPLLPAGAQATSNETRHSHNGGAIMAFLDAQFASRGPQSVIYISFGSLFWPRDPAKLSAVLDVIMEKGIPFVMSHAASSAWPLPDDLKARIAAYGNGIVSDWVPQQALLEHPATGWYLMHGGHNGTLETILAGVPMIVWPIDADQPYNAVYLSEGINVAYELIEVRHGSGLGRIYRNGRLPIGTIDAVKDETRRILDQAFGEDGAGKRVRLQGLRKKLQAAWADNGVARREVEAFLDGLQ
ncbi:UDP-Glycosyltransferase/glycogen phosphorylase [Trametes meyenii]|nr:UDP-Glycosyltransferase/glycogen phosphorylase [Trametes meyenii]